MTDHNTRHTTSRREFLKAAAAGTAAALVSGLVGLQPAQAASMAASPAAAVDHTLPLTLEGLNSAAFAPYLHERFYVETPAGEVFAAELHDVYEWSAQRANGAAVFSIVLRQVSGSPLPQDVYTVTHGALGSFTLLLAPASAEATLHEAVFA